MKKYELVLNNNEELMVDVDDLMEQELTKFQKSITGLTEEDLHDFANWIKVYKLLNYDIIEGLTIDKVYKVNEASAVVELTFRGNKEYDFIGINFDKMTVICTNMKNDKVREYTVRRLLIPNTVEEALMFAKAKLSNKAIQYMEKTLKDLKANESKYDVTDIINIHNKTIENNYVPKQHSNNIYSMKGSDLISDGVNIIVNKIKVDEMIKDEKNNIVQVNDNKVSESTFNKKSNEIIQDNVKINRPKETKKEDKLFNKKSNEIIQDNVKINRPKETKKEDNVKVHKDEPFVYTKKDFDAGCYSMSGDNIANPYDCYAGYSSVGRR